MEGLNFVGAGLACLAMLGAAIGVGNIFAAYLDGAMRNPSAAPQQFGNLIFGFAVTEALGTKRQKRDMQPEAAFPRSTKSEISGYPRSSGWC